MTITLHLPFEHPDEVAEALYYARQAVELMLVDEPHQEPATVLWEELTERQRMIWRMTAGRVIALYTDMKQKKGPAEAGPEDTPY